MWSVSAGAGQGWRLGPDRRPPNGDERHEDGGEALSRSPRVHGIVHITDVCSSPRQHTIRAARAGVVRRVLFREGSQANRHAALVEMEEEEEAAAGAE